MRKRKDKTYSALSTKHTFRRFFESQGIFPRHFLTVRTTRRAHVCEWIRHERLNRHRDLVHRLYELFQCYCHICAVIKLHALLCCTGQNIHCSFSVSISFSPLFFLLNLFLIVGNFQIHRYVVFLLERGTMSLEEYFVFAEGRGMRRNSKIVDSVNMCIILLKHVQQTVR